MSSSDGSQSVLPYRTRDGTRFSCHWEQAKGDERVDPNHLRTFSQLHIKLLSTCLEHFAVVLVTLCHGSKVSCRFGATTKRFSSSFDVPGPLSFQRYSPPHETPQEDVYPKGPSVMFYKMFLDTDVRSNLSQYDALAIIEWDVLVASERSFEELYYATFRVNEEFWVKGSNLEGTNFHSSSTMSDMWHVLGHINGNAIYNNNDPAFVEYVRYTLSRWEYSYPYDVALWLTISDFPYSWPLYQRFSNKFVTTNLVRAGQKLFYQPARRCRTVRTTEQMRIG